MYLSTLLPVALLASLAVAQTSSSSTTSACAAQPVLEACLASTEAIAAGCASTDYGCLCQKWTDVVTCFQQCPNDSRFASIHSEQETYCADATVYTSSTSSLASVRSSAAAATTSGNVNAATTTSGTTQTTGSATGTSTSSSASSSASKNAAMRDLWVNPGGVLAAVAGVAGALL
ncbi:hypothetical protein BP5796_02395 [Coleophoma crateriformis]|uniref:Extracellular membrane protein CFEM domain-containing protein n=1 Tax=Coleophoma crateriformis TaxID=565419 RepID=A0A3D8SY96_9HELO|nr:hypothetical protein BP5796_02395 [Coleophoma crateriformis]